MPKAKMLDLTTKVNTDAEDLFTDRTEPRKAFWDIYDSMENGNYEIIAYYGVGGIGKTTLLKQIGKEIDSRVEDGRFDHLFVSFESKPEKERVLYMISRQLMILNKDLKCPVFDEAFCRLLEQEGKSSAPYEKQMKDIISDNPVLSAAADLAGDFIPGMGAAVKTVESIISFSRTKIKEKDMTDGRDAYLYNEIRYSETKDLRNRLHLYLRHDLQLFMAQRNKPFVFLIDGYENFVDIREKGKEARNLEADEWLKNPESGLAAMPNTIWVIAGREQPNWDSDVLPGDHMHRIGDLSENDTIDFFTKAGIEDPGLKKSLYKLTNGTPAYMDMCVDTYRKTMRDHKPEMADFGRDTSELARRYLEKMGRNMSNMVAILTGLPNVWEVGLARSVAEKLEMGGCISALDEILVMSITERVDDGYKLHQTLRNVIIEEYKKDAGEKAISIIARASLTAFGILLDRLSGSEDSDDRTAAFKACGELLEKLDNAIPEENLKELMDILDEEEIQTGNYRLSGDILASIAEYIHKCGCSDELAVFVQNHVNSNLLALGMYYEFREQSEKTYEFALKTLGEENPGTLAGLNNLANSCHATGDNERAVELHKKCYESRLKVLGAEHKDTLSSLGNLAESCSSAGDYAEALELERKCYELSKRILGENDPDTLTSLNNLAGVYSLMGDYEKALELEKECYELRKAIFGEEHPDTINSLNSLAYGFSMVGECAEALELRKKCYPLCVKVMGEMHPATLICLNNLAGSYSDAEEYDKALELYEKCYDLCVRVLGEEHPDTLLCLGNLAGSYSDVEEYDKSLKLRQKSYELYVRILGEEHPGTIISLNNLAYGYMEVGDYVTAIELYEKCYKISVRVLGEGHPDTRICLYNMAHVYDEAGESEKAEELFEMYDALES